MECARLKKILVITFFILLLLTSCSNYSNGNIQKVGMLTEGTIEEHAWVKEGYEGLKNITDEYDVDLLNKEYITTEEEIRDAVNDLAQKGVNLIFGHSSNYGKSFFEISKIYPEVHFVYFNGTYYNDNLTSLNFNSHAVGFFAGMLASEMSETNEVGIIASYQWQPEIEGFYEGAKYKNNEVNVQMDFIYDWNDTSVALDMYEQMKNKDVDVFYPAGDAFSEEIIQQASEDHLYAIGLVSDQQSVNRNTVLTNTVQNIADLYIMAAEEFNKGQLSGDIITFDFKDEVLSFGEFSPDVPQPLQDEIMEAVENYKETGLLPNQ